MDNQKSQESEPQIELSDTVMEKFCRGIFESIRVGVVELATLRLSEIQDAVECMKGILEADEETRRGVNAVVIACGITIAQVMIEMHIEGQSQADTDKDPTEAVNE